MVIGKRAFPLKDGHIKKLQFESEERQSNKITMCSSQVFFVEANQLTIQI